MTGKQHRSTANQPEALWLRCRQLVQDAAEHLLDPRCRMLAASVQWWELPGFPERWPVAVLGEGPPLLYVCGCDGSFLDATPLAVLLARHHRVVIPDLYGFGFSPRPSDGDYSAEGILRHIEAVLASSAYRQATASDARPNASGRLGVIGHSMGTRVALDLVRRQPDRIDRLMLLAPSGLTDPPLSLPLSSLMEFFAAHIYSRPAVREWLRRFMHADAGRTCSAGELEICSIHLRTPGWADSLRRFSRSGGFGHCRDPLPPVPILGILGTEDRLLNSRQKRLARELLGEQLLDLPAGGHLAQWEHPDWVAETWINFCGRPVG